MEIEFCRFSENRIEAVRELNARLVERGFAGTLFPDRAADLGAAAAAAGLARRYVLAVEGASVRGGYVLKEQAFVFPSGERKTLGTFQVPVSQGVVDKRYALVGLYLLMDAMRSQPLLFTLGIGGPEEPLARMLESASWRIHPVDFYFRIVHPANFLRHIAFLRTASWRRRLLDVLAASRLAHVPIRCYHLLRERRRGAARRCRHEVVERFGAWADELWREAKSAYSLAAVRDATTLDALYPASDPRFIRLRVRRGNADLGWALVMNNALEGHRHFGSMRLGSIVDVLALPGAEARVVMRATRYLEDNGADLVVSNQSHLAWRVAMRDSGYFRGPSNFLFAASPALVESLDPYEEMRRRIHMTRGDGDGPIHL